MGRRTLGKLRPVTLEEPTVNLTPLIDVVFVILIMFIFVAPLLELDRVELAEAPKGPTDGLHDVQSPSLLSIHVRKDNTILINNKPINLTLLPEIMVKAKQAYPDVTPQLFHDKEAPFGTYQAIKNAAEMAGFEQLDVILKPS